jgi:ABC-2 type transport system permease protein
MQQLASRSMAWWVFFRISVEERLVYRGDFALGTLMRFLPIVTQIFLWWAIFESVRANGDASQTISSYSYQDMVAYYLLAMVSRAFSSMPGLTGGIARQIQSGEIKKFLIQPVDMLGCLLLQRMAHKFVYYVVATLPFAFVFWLCRGFFEQGWPSLEVLTAFLASLIMAFLLGFFMEACMGLVAFWFLEVSSLVFIYMLMNFFLSGHMFPLELLGTEGGFTVRGAIDLLPLKYLAYFPAAVFLGKVEGAALWQGLALEAFWVVFFILLSRVLWWRGLKRYSGFGG